MGVIRVGGQEHEYLAISIVGRSYPTCRDYWDGNWLNAVVSLAAGGFRGKIDPYLRAEEFVAFRDELLRLAQLPTAVAHFSTMEEWLSIELSGDRLGHIELKCEIRDQPGIGNTLRFRLALDQTDLQAMLAQVQAAVLEFPVVGRPDH
jgi:hypothetical protein